MAGIYLHIPFCKQSCSYCDFHFSTTHKHKPLLVDALIEELTATKNLLKEATINSIYFGGGTPSLLSEKELNQIVHAIYKNYAIDEEVEFTLECNPDDLNATYLAQLKANNVNRLSIGIQSFFDDDLSFFNRAHCSKEAEKSILLSQDIGFENINIDLIYGSPTLTNKKWEENLEKIKTLNVPHLSAYSLTIESKTMLAHQVKNGKIRMPTDEINLQQFKMLIERTKKFGLTHYEISNFGKEGFFSKHNSNYWKGINYLGIGPSAHSFIGDERFWNVAHNQKYIAALKQGLPYQERETIDPITAYNEYILTRLRTFWGINASVIEQQFDQDINSHFRKELSKYLDSPYLRQEKEKFFLTDKGLFIADKISADLFYVS